MFRTFLEAPDVSTDYPRVLRGAVPWLAVMPSAAWAQSVFAGTVKDSSGAVMPGVTVEAASPALIEKVRSAVTDENGVYRIIDLRPGVYTLTFTLPGFNTVTREGLELGSNFTATINVELSVGTLQESITVSGASPVVDVQSNVKQQVLSRDVLDAVPTAKTIQGLGQLVVGVTLNSPDVGGSRAMQQTYFAIRGQGGAQTVVLVDGLMTNGLMGDGAVQAYHNEAMTQEAVYQTAGGSAETLTGGVNMNLVPEGRRQPVARRLQVRQVAGELAGRQPHRRPDRARASPASIRIANFYEINVEQGGPILRNKLWFYGAFRKAQYDKPIANTFVHASRRANFPAFFRQCANNPGTCEQGVSDEKMNNPVVRLTWQASERNKIAAYMDRALRLRGHAMGALTDPNTASVIWNTPTFATGSVKWTRTASSQAAARERLLVQPRALRQPLSAGHPRRAQHRRVVPQRPQGRHQHAAAVECLERAARELSRSLQPAVGGVVRHRLAQHQVRRDVSVGLLPPLQQRQRRPLSDLQERRAAARHRAQHAARGAGEPRRQLRRLRPGLVESRTS